jgi:predicted MFS family arabinose efflux permease
LKGLRQQLRKLLLASFIQYVTVLVMAMFPNFEVMTACRAIQGAVSPLICVYGLTVVAQCFNEASRGMAIALVIAGNIAGELIGSFAGGYLFYLGGMRMPFYVTIAVSIVNFLSLFIALLVAEPHSGRDEEITPPPKGESWWAPLKVLLKDRFVLACCLVVFGAQGLKTTTEVILPLFLQNQLGANEMAVSIFSGFMAISFVLSSIVHGYLGDKGLVSPAKLIPVNCLVVAASGFGSMYYTDIRPILIGLALFGAGLGGTLSPSCDELLAYTGKNIPDVPEVVVVTLFNDFWAFGLVVGSCLAGIPNEFDRIGQRATLGAAGCVVGAIGALFSYAYLQTGKAKSLVE